MAIIKKMRTYDPSNQKKFVQQRYYRLNKLNSEFKKAKKCKKTWKAILKEDQELEMVNDSDLLEL